MKLDLDYLFSNKFTKSSTSKFREIVDCLREVRSQTSPNGDKYSQYEIYVTGHSLGGALAQLLSFTLAGSCWTRDILPMPIRAVTFASPRVGDRDFLRVYQTLEAKGVLRHICISNDGDVVCKVPSLGYVQTGLNIHLCPYKEAELAYSVQRRLWITPTLCNVITNKCSASNIKGMHSLETYFERLIASGRNGYLLSKSVDELYRECIFVSICEDQKKKQNSKITKSYKKLCQKMVDNNVSFSKSALLIEMYSDFLSA